MEASQSGLGSATPPSSEEEMAAWGTSIQVQLWVVTSWTEKCALVYKFGRIFLVAWKLP